MQQLFISIEGNIGVGKTTLSQVLAKHYNAQLILESFDNNPFLPKFYEKPEQYAFQVELFFLAERFKQLKEIIQPNLFSSITVADYFFTKSLLFAKMNLPEDEYRLYKNFFEVISQQLPQPDVMIYLYTSVEKLQQNIKQRNRSYEQNISNDYLLNVQQVYTNFFKQNTVPTLYVEATHANFNNNQLQVQQIVEGINICKETTKNEYLILQP